MELPEFARWQRDTPILRNFLVHRQQVAKFRGVGTTTADIIAELATLGLYRNKKDALAFIKYLVEQGEIFPTIDNAHYCSVDDKFTLNQ